MYRRENYLTDFQGRERFLVSARGVCIHKNKLLVERPKDTPEGLRNCCYIPGGGLELGELLEECLRREYQEETNAKITSLVYLFLVENHIRFGNKIIHSIEHYFRVELDKYTIQPRESRLDHFWIPIEDLLNSDFCPTVVGEVIVDGTWGEVRHLVQPP